MKIIRAMSVTYQPYAECVEDSCKFAWPCSHNTRQVAKDHAKATGHHVRVIVETVDLYRPETPAPAPITATGDAHDTPHYQSRGNNL